MNRQELMVLVKSHLRLDTEDYDLVIFDLIQEICDYCNLDRDEIPEELETYIRKKVKGVVDYEREHGSGFQQKVSSITEGSTTVSFLHSDEDSRSYICELNDANKKLLNRYRKLRW